jgi:hypothetical protein
MNSFAMAIKYMRKLVNNTLGNIDQRSGCVKYGLVRICLISFWRNKGILGV